MAESSVFRTTYHVRGGLCPFTTMLVWELPRSVASPLPPTTAPRSPQRFRSPAASRRASVVSSPRVARLSSPLSKPAAEPQLEETTEAVADENPADQLAAPQLVHARISALLGDPTPGDSVKAREIRSIEQLSLALPRSPRAPPRSVETGRILEDDESDDGSLQLELDDCKVCYSMRG